MAKKVGSKVEVKNKDLEAQGELLSQEGIDVLKAVDFTGEITQIQDGLFYVGFVDPAGNWLTQVFKEDEIVEVE